MELGGFESPTSWVRSRGSNRESQWRKVGLQGLEARIGIRFRPKSRRICADIHADMRGFGHERPVVPNSGDMRFEIAQRTDPIEFRALFSLRSSVYSFVNLNSGVACGRRQSSDQSPTARRNREREASGTLVRPDLQVKRRAATA